MPAVLFTSVLAARRIPDMLSALRVPQTLRTRCASDRSCRDRRCQRVNRMAAAPLWIADNPPAVAARWLERNVLTNGVGEYWSSNLITAMSGDTVGVRSVVPRAGRLVPYVLAGGPKWFARPPRFVIWQDGNLTGLTLDHVRATYAICRLESVAGCRIAVVADRVHACGGR